MVNGKAKGNQYEREVARKLSKWLSNGKRDDLLWRSNSSGGQFTQATKGRGGFETQAGDLAAIDSTDENSNWFMNNFVVELKRYNDLQVSNVIYHKKSKLLEFWDVHHALAKKVGRIPLLIAKEDRQPEILLLPSGQFDLTETSLNTAIIENEGVSIILLEEFLIIPFEWVKEHWS